jgi:hypothetical protein
MPFRKNLFRARWLSFLAGCWFALIGVRAEIQFDVFVGYDGNVRAAGWHPISFEVYNDGPSFEGTIEVSASQFGGQTQRYALSLPNGTRKRLVIPSFCSSGSGGAVNARLLDASGKVRAERPGQPPNVVAWESVLLGSLAVLSQGGPALPEIDTTRSEMQPKAARIQTEFFPDNPIALEGLSALYLNSARALDLKEPQVDALQSWVHSGGHLIVAIDQAADLTTATWLKSLLPASVGAVGSQQVGGSLTRWLMDDSVGHPGQSGAVFRHAFETPKLRMGHDGRQDRGDSAYSKLKVDNDFQAAQWPVFQLKPLAGAVTMAGTKDVPLIVTTSKDRGMVTVLAFNPEREPLKTWKLRPYFWARLSGVSEDVFRKELQMAWGGKSLDSIYGAMVETRQVRKLPVGLLLLLLVVYLVVIGPLDQWWLKKINRPMLTWITFPAYVALFSLLIYFIGFKLRAGQTEWNELHVVDVVPRNADAVLRGRVFASLYSPANQSYRVSTEATFASLRSEFSGLWSGAPSDARTGLKLSQKPGFSADLYVPVWSSQMNVMDWQIAGDPPLTATFVRGQAGGKLHLNNPRSRAYSGVWVVMNREVFELGELAAGSGKDYTLKTGNESRPLKSWIQQFNEPFRTASAAREHVLGGNEGTHIDRWDQASIAASFASILSVSDTQTRDLIYPPGYDLGSLAERGDTLVFAWLPDETLIPQLNQFTALRSTKGTLIRLVLPAAADAP